jgi:hypothetical protein
MPNPIKYTIGSETDALKKGNFYIGTGSVGKGPSESTGYYQGPSPVSGGYVIYLNRPGAPGDLSYNSVLNDAELISFTNSLAGQSYTGVQQCFDYFYSQNDKVLVNQDYPANYPYIVMDGLVFNLDAGITQSYPGSGTTWTDINGLGPRNNGTLINGPTFNSANGGSIVFDGVDDFVDCGDNSSLNLTNNFSLCAWVRRNSIQSSVDSGIIGKLTNANGYQGYLLWYNGGGISLYIRSGVRASTGAIIADTNYYVVGTYNGSTASIYVNGMLVESNPTNVLAVPTGVNFQIGKYTFSSSRNFAGNIFNTHVYNRALSAQEVLQNYNATKSRYGL